MLHFIHIRLFLLHRTQSLMVIIQRLLLKKFSSNMTLWTKTKKLLDTQIIPQKGIFHSISIKNMPGFNITHVRDAK